jgi:hypothetical protein
MLQTPSLSINIDQSKAHADEGDRPHQTTYHYDGLLSSGATGAHLFQDELNVLNAHNGGNHSIFFIVLGVGERGQFLREE